MRSEARSNLQIVSTRASLTTPHGGTRRRFIDRLDDAQDTRDTVSSFGYFSATRKKSNNGNNYPILIISYKRLPGVKAMASNVDFFRNYPTSSI